MLYRIVYSRLIRSFFVFPFLVLILLSSSCRNPGRILDQYKNGRIGSTDFSLYKNGGVNGDWYLISLYHQDNSALQLEALELSDKYDSGIFKTEALFDLAQLNLSFNYWADAEKAASKGFKLSGQERFLGILVEALYWQYKDELVLEHFSLYPPTIQEEKLFRAVSAFRVRDPDWKEYVRSFFLEVSNPVYLKRGAEFFFNESLFEESFDALELEAFRFMYRVGAMDENAAPLFQEDFARLPAAFTPRLSTLASNASYAERLRRDYFGQRNELSGLELYYLGRILLNTGNYSQAIEVLTPLTKNYPDAGRQMLRAAQLLGHNNLTNMIGIADQQGLQGGSSWYRYGLLDDYLSELVARGQFNTIRSLEGNLLIPELLMPRLLWVIGLAYEYGYLKGENSESYYERILTLNGHSYFHQMASARLGMFELVDDVDASMYEDLQEEFSSGILESSRISRLQNILEGSENMLLEGVEKLVSHGFVEKAYELINRYEEDLSTNAILQLSLVLQQHAAYLEALRLSYGNLSHSDPGLELLVKFPLAFRPEIQSISAFYDVPWYVTMGLIREESLFDAEIVSHAGAIGLSQLMPATAADMAQRMRLDSYSETDPEDNISIGVYFHNDLRKRVGPLHALFAYNGGLSRVRQWNSQFSRYPNELYLEAIPFKETRDYGRKVVSSAVIYGTIYAGLEPKEILEDFFPNSP
jgi:hypothetical protein